MKNELTISKGNSATRITDMAAKATETQSIIDALSATNNKTAQALVKEQKLNHLYQLGYILGCMKADYDCMPDELAAQQKFNGIPVNLLVKMKIDEMVLDAREEAHADDFTRETEYSRKYRRLCEMICGYGYNMSFIEDRFERFYPNGSHKVVEGFATGYSETFHDICNVYGIETATTDPKTQDIWKNFEFFTKREVHEYTLEGLYHYMYNGGVNCSGNPNVPYGSNMRMVNEGVYQKLKARSACEFEKTQVNFNF